MRPESCVKKLSYKICLEQLWGKSYIYHKRFAEKLSSDSYAKKLIVMWKKL